MYVYMRLDKFTRFCTTVKYYANATSKYGDVTDGMGRGVVSHETIHLLLELLGLVQ